MISAYETLDSGDIVQCDRTEAQSWAESTFCSVVDSIEEYARAKPLPFGLWAFGIGFVLGWKLKIW
jgi:hypothetical protein